MIRFKSLLLSLNIKPLLNLNKMKKIILVSLVAMLAISGTLFAQSNKKSVEVLYFKANLACCKARACDALEGNIKAVIEKTYTDGKVNFKTVKIADEANKTLVDQYKAQSQTVVIVSKNRKKVITSDVSEMVSAYALSNDKDKFETAFTAKINESLK